MEIDGARLKVREARIESLDALRAIAALLVLVFHYELLSQDVRPGDPPKAMDAIWAQYGLMGVELFFVISGFVILMTLERAPTIFNFAVNRAARLYPAYWASVIVTAAYLLPLGEANLRTAILNMTMLQRFVNGRDLITAYWSLGYELWFYAIMATVAACGALNRVPVLSLLWLLVSSALLLVGLRPQGLAGFFAFTQFGHLFIAGMMIHLIAAARGTPVVWVVLGLCIAYSLFGRPDWSGIPFYGYFAANAIFISLVYLAAKGQFSAIARPYLVAVGRSSYSLYLFHIVIGMALIRGCVAVDLPPWTGAIAAVPVSLAAAELSRRLIEVPGQRAIVRLAARFSPQRREKLV
jgi:peptidoglycan/LPS O-acetylase OafA/YrhL